MALVDELTIHARAGKGGNGVVRWLNLKGKEYSGPAGGNGGNGGDVFIHAVGDLSMLGKYRGEKKFEAEKGADGENRNCHGKGGKDLTIDLPVGSVVHNRATGEVHELLEVGQTILVLKGGRGGAGNAAFKSSTNINPQEAMPGVPGEEADLYIELRLIATAGLVGLPNAGKSSLLNALTGARAKIGAYPFTTLDPNLGAFYGSILADIPGLIEGASQGKGLGAKFLRHISRTKLLLHCVSLEAEQPLEAYDTVRTELERFTGADLAHTPEVIVLTKSDTRDPEEIASIKAAFEAKGREVWVVSVLDDTQIKTLGDSLSKALQAL